MREEESRKRGRDERSRREGRGVRGEERREGEEKRQISVYEVYTNPKPIFTQTLCHTSTANYKRVINCVECILSRVW